MRGSNIYRKRDIVLKKTGNHLLQWCLVTACLLWIHLVNPSSVFKAKQGIFLTRVEWSKKTYEKCFWKFIFKKVNTADNINRNNQFFVQIIINYIFNLRTTPLLSQNSCSLHRVLWCPLYQSAMVERLGCCCTILSKSHR